MMVHPDSHGVSRAPQYSGTFCAAFGFAYGAITRYGAPSQKLPLPNYGSRLKALQPPALAFTPNNFETKASARFGLFPFRSPLLWESRLISLPPGTEMFHFPGLASLSLCIQLAMTGYDSSRVSPFGNPRFIACLAAPRGLSQPTTSFFACRRQGIHLLPLVSYPTNITSFHPLFNCQRANPSFNLGAKAKLLCAKFQTKVSKNAPLVVEVNGIEPMTPCVQGRCSPS